MIKIPLKNKLRYLLYSSYTISGFIFLLVTLFLLIDIYDGIDLLAFQIKKGSPTTKGIVMESYYWGQGIDNDDYYEISYSYQNPMNQETYFWSSYSKTPITEGTEVEIIYVKNEPSVSKIKGLTNSVVSQVEVFITLFIFILSMIVISIGISIRLKQFRILKNGIPVYGNLSKPRKGYNRDLDEIQFDFITKENNRIRGTIHCYRLKDIKSTKKELIVYHKRKSKIIVLIDNFPIHLKEVIQEQIYQQHPELKV